MVKPATPSALPFVETWRRAVLASELHTATKVVAIGMARHMNGDGTSSRAGGTRLAHETHLDRANVVRARTILVDRGWLEVVGSGGSGRGEQRTASEYRATLPISTTGGTTPPVARRHQWQDDIRTGGTTPPRTSGTTPPKVVTTGSHKERAKGSTDEWGQLLTERRPPYEEELETKLAELTAIHGPPVVDRAVAELLRQRTTFRYPTQIAAALTGIIRANAPANGAAIPPEWNSHRRSNDPMPDLPTKPPDWLLPRNRTPATLTDQPPF